MKKLFLILSFLGLAFVVVGCKAERLDSDSPYGDSTISPEGGMVSEKGDSVVDPDGDEHQGEKPQAGQLSASEWSDLKNYNFWLGLFASGQESKEGLFAEHFNKGYFDTLNMIEVVVKNNQENLSGIKVELLSSGQKVIYTAVSNANGKAYLFPSNKELTAIKQIGLNVNGEKVYYEYTYAKENNIVEYNIAKNNSKVNTIEIMFVIDTTGSMGDEISYLKAEIDYVIGSVKEAHQEAEIRLALLFYRDLSDDYVTRYFDFTTDIAKQKRNLAAQNADGGGDWEEAVEIALDEAVDKNWSSDNTTKLLFHVLDAPPHFIPDVMNKYENAIRTASSKGIRMIPLASSGIDKYTEYLLRNEAMMTGGTYTFITNDSGIGEEHIEATVGETVVEYLNIMLIRIINEYYTGVEQVKRPYYTYPEK